ncbi:RraA family protein [Mycolicibacterium sp.]|uniref:RraA family protein n=1 Tax=Mycolicibacterium sp. TaxID=2320850 RepID=UPI0037C66AEB
MDYSQAFRGIVTPDLSDACDALGIEAITTGAPKGVYAECRRICGPVVTYELRPDAEGSVVIGTLEGIVSAAPGSVLMFGTHERTDLNAWGSIAATVAVQQRMAGVITDGSTRDIETMRELDFPTYAAGTVVTSVRGRIGLASVNEPIPFAGGTVEAGWIAAADENGVIVFPPDNVEEVFQRAYRVAALERKTLEAIRCGADAVAIHKQLRYDATWTEQLNDDSLVG